MVRVLFVCLGNICRSPAAEGIMNKYLTQKNMNNHVQCDSAGTSGYHDDELPDSRMRQCASDRGFNLDSRSRKLKKEDLDIFDYIIAMDGQNMSNIKGLIEKNHEHYQKKIHMMTHFCRNHKVKDVPDPYFSSEDGFNQVLDLLDDAVCGLIDHLKEDCL